MKLYSAHDEMEQLCPRLPCSDIRYIVNTDSGICWTFLLL